jgi:hypothetical protein
MSTTNTTPPSEEVDLGQLFKMIGSAFNRLFQFIGSIFKHLFLAFVWIVFFLKKRALVFSSALVLGLILGFFVERNSEKYYKSTFSLKQNYETGEKLYNSVDFYNGLLKDKDYDVLAQNLGIKKETAEDIIRIELQPIVTDNDKILMFNKYIKQLDSLAASKVDYQDYINNIATYKYKFQKLIITSKGREKFKNVFENIIKSITESTFFINEQNKDLSQFQSQKLAIERSLLQSDSLQRTYKRVLEQQIDPKISSEIGITFEGNNDKNKTREYDLYKNDIELRRERVIIDRQIKDKANIIDIISSNQDSGNIEDKRYLFGVKIHIKFYYVVALLLLSLTALLGLEFFKFLERYNPEYKTSPKEKA